MVYRQVYTMLAKLILYSDIYTLCIRCRYDNATDLFWLYFGAKIVGNHASTSPRANISQRDPLHFPRPAPRAPDLQLHHDQHPELPTCSCTPAPRSTGSSAPQHHDLHLSPSITTCSCTPAPRPAPRAPDLQLHHDQHPELPSSRPFISRAPELPTLWTQHFHGRDGVKINSHMSPLIRVT